MLICVKNDAQSCLREPSMCRYDVPIIIFKIHKFYSYLAQGNYRVYVIIGGFSSNKGAFSAR